AVVAEVVVRILLARGQRDPVARTLWVACGAGREGLDPARLLHLAHHVLAGLEAHRVCAGPIGRGRRGEGVARVLRAVAVDVRVRLDRPAGETGLTGVLLGVRIHVLELHARLRRV